MRANEKFKTGPPNRTDIKSYLSIKSKSFPQMKCNQSNFQHFHATLLKHFVSNQMAFEMDDFQIELESNEKPFATSVLKIKWNEKQLDLTVLAQQKKKWG
jgi:hypothetical protein